MTLNEAITEAREWNLPYVASIRSAGGEVGAIACRSELEALRWINMYKDWGTCPVVRRTPVWSNQ